MKILLISKLTIFDEKNKKTYLSLHKDIIIKVFYTIKERKYLSIRLIKTYFLYKYI